MAVDRGGLEYPVSVEDQFSASLDRFKAKLEEGRRAFTEFQGALASGANLGIGGAGGLAEVSRVFAALSSNAGTAQAGFAQLNAQVQQLARAFGQVNQQGPAAQLANANRQAGSLQQTVSRLIVSFAAFTAIRFGFNVFEDLLVGAVDFNKTIENSQLNIASLILAVGNVADATGKAVGGSQGLALALREAGKQTEQLRQDALKTSVSFEELVKTFQVAVGPGLQGGLQLDEIRRLTVQMAQAAKAIGLDETKFASEIRLILSGTITQRTRLANALGITSADIQKAREAGDLADFLEKKFGAFTLAAQAGLDTFSVLANRAHAALTQLVATNSLEFFGELKGLLADVFTKTQDPAAAVVVHELASAFAEVVHFARELFGALDPSTLVAGIKLVEEGLLRAQVGLELLILEIARLGPVADLIFPGFSLIFDKLGLSTENLSEQIAAAEKKLADGLDEIERRGTKTADALKSAGLGNAFDNLPPVIERSSTEMDVVRKHAADLTKEVQGTKIALQEGLRDLGLTGVNLQEQKAITAELRKFHEQDKVFRDEEQRATRQLVEFRSQQAALDEKINGLGLEDQARVDKAVAAGEEQLAAVRALAEAKDAQAQQQLALTAAERAGSADKRAEAVEGLASTQAAVALAQQKLDKTREESAVALRNAGALAPLALQRLTLEGQTEGALRDQAIAQENVARFSLQENAAIAQKVQLLAAQASIKLHDENTILAAQAAAALAIQEAKDSIQPFALERAQLQNQIDELIAQRTKVHEENVRDIAHTAELLAALTASSSTGGSTTDAADVAAVNTELQTQTALQTQLAEQQTKDNQQLDLAATKAKTIGTELEKVTKQAFSPFAAALPLVLENFKKQAQQEAQELANIITGTVKSFSDTTAQLIVDAFDPTKKVDLQAAFAQFLQNLSKQIISFLIQLAITRAVLGIASAAGFKYGGEVAGIQGFAEGGEVSPAHYGVKAPPPAGLDRKDTVPIWAEPGEFMLRLDSVRKYGADVIQSINDGLIDPLELRGLAGVARASRASRRSGRGFAAGGLISDTAINEVRARSNQGAGSPTRAYLVADEATAERILAAGERGLDRYLNSRQGKIASMVRK